MAEQPRRLRWSRNLQQAVDAVPAPAAPAALAAPAAQAEIALQHGDMVAATHRQTAEPVASSLGTRFEVNTQILFMSPELISAMTLCP